MMKLEKLAQAGIGIYLLLPGPEDAVTGGLSLGPTAVLGGILIADAFGVKI